ncbi:MAG: hypothetical protein ACSHX7_14660 [Luteolibacter sp.]
MRKTAIFIFTILALALDLSAFTGSKTLERKTAESSTIIQGKVVGIVRLSVPEISVDSPESEILVKKSFGPAAVALVYVEKVIKGNPNFLRTIVYMPCDYNLNESPSEVTESVRYVLFLEALGKNFFHPLDSYSTHRIFEDKIGLSGFDWKGDFDPDSKNGKNMSLEKFLSDVNDLLKSMHESEK